MRQVWKLLLVPKRGDHPLDDAKEEFECREIDLPRHAKILAVGVGRDYQRDDVFLWAEVDSTEKTEKVQLYAVPTGQDFEPRGKRYLDTVQIAVVGTGAWVFHIYVKVNP